MPSRTPPVAPSSSSLLRSVAPADLFTLLSLLLWDFAILRLADAHQTPGALFHVIQELAEASFVPGAFVLGAGAGASRRTRFRTSAITTRSKKAATREQIDEESAL